MDLLFIIDPLPSLKIYKDSSYAMMREAAQRGHQLHIAYLEDLAVQQGQVVARATPLALQEGPDWYHCGAATHRTLASFDAVLMRKDPPFDLEYLYATHLLQQAVQAGAKVWNDPQALRDHNEKLAILTFPQFTAPTLVAKSATTLKAFIAEQEEVVLKPLDGMGGSGIFRVRVNDPNLSVILETMTRQGQQTIMAQRYLPQIEAGDKRILLIAGKPVPYCLARIPAPGETRGNLAAGGTGRAQALSASDLEIANTLGPILWARGLFLVGLDVIGTHLTEINVTSPTCFQEITQQTGFNVAQHFIEALELV
ncbi:glutathione synthase [Parvibium lacunae]|uniref:Glutathione synthetase n=1 Tax=Parvibium lacunae TaxID=1888893 RepID=A0A368L0M5_9BURK|nr:glutathione synthase [Parvibium lacunae]RCS57108.1 glutathione synthase [Parvibium lacunae]